VTILFSDIVGSTALGERLEPETLSRVMREYFAAVKPAVERHGGTLAKFIGDAVMAVFGLTRLHEDDALRAVRAAVEMQRALAELNRELERRYGLMLSARTGINTGPVAGEGLTPDRNFVAGDTANTAARLQSSAGAGEILLGEATYRLVRAGVEAELLPPLELKGKLGAVTAYRLLAVAESAEGVPRRLDAPLIGRERELETLRQEFRRAVEEGRCRLVTLVGEAGVGKSRLVRELASAVRDEATVLQGRCLPYGEGITYWPLAQIVRRAAAIEDGDPAGEALDKIAALLGDALVAEHVGGLVGLTERQPPPGEVPPSVRALVERLAAERPLVSVVDDIHWAESTLLELLEYLGARAAAPVLLLCVSRPELLDRRSEWPGVVRLQPLSTEESVRLVRALLHEAGVPEQAVERICAAAGGNPLFCEQMVAMLIDEGRIGREGDRWVARGDLSSLGVPPTLHALIAARLDGLEPAERTTLARAAVVGEEFSKDVVRELLPAEVGAVESLLAALVRKELVAPVRDRERFAFRHLVIRDVAYETLTKEDRADLHERVGDWIELTAASGASTYDEIVGYHLEQAYRYHVALHAVDDQARRLAGRACDLLAAAGRRAYRRGDVPATIALLARALDLMEKDEPRRPALLVDLGRAAMGVFRLDEAEAAFTEAVDAAATAGEEGAELIAQVALLSYRVVIEPEAVDFEAALEQARIALDRYARAGDDLGIARACRLLGWVHIRRCELGLAATALEQGIEAGRRAGDVLLRIDLPNLVVALARGAAPTSYALARGPELLELARGDRLTEASVESALGVVHALRGEFEHGRALVHRAILVHEELGHLMGVEVHQHGLGYIEALARNWPAHESAWRHVHQASVAIGRRDWIVESAVELGESLYRAGRVHEAERFAAIAAEQGVPHPHGPDTQAPLLRLQAKLRAHDGAHEEADRLVREALAASFEVDSPWLQADTLMDLAEVLELAGRPDEAREAVKRALQLYEQKEHLVGVERARAALASPVRG
jgi:class 3 adenylate cyclase/tetratricopeptide (TPR) repeat protein